MKTQSAQRIIAACAAALGLVLVVLVNLPATPRVPAAWLEASSPAPTPLHGGEGTGRPEPFFVPLQQVEASRLEQKQPSAEQAEAFSLACVEGKFIAWVSDASGAPLPELALRLEPIGPRSPVRWLHGHTDDQGRAAIHDVPAGTYQLSAQLSSGLRHTRLVTLVDGREELNWILPAATVRLRGRLVDDEGVGLQDHRVAACSLPTGERVAVAATDEEGRFALPALPPGTYDLESSLTAVGRHALGRDWPWNGRELLRVEAWEPNLDLGSLTRPAFEGYIVEGRVEGPGSIALAHPARKSPLPLRVDGEGRFAWASEAVPQKLELHWSCAENNQAATVQRYPLLPAAGQREHFDLR